MSETGNLDPQQFGASFRRFMDAMEAVASTPSSPLFDRIRDHLGADPAQLPVVAEEFDPHEHASVQVALDAYLKEGDRRADLVGVAIENRRWAQMSLSDLFSRGPNGRRPLAEGPVDYVNFRLPGDGGNLACVQFGLYLIAEGDARVVMFVSGPSDRFGPRVKLRLEAMAANADDASAVLAQLVDGTSRHNVYRGHTISLSPPQMMGPGASHQVESHTLPKVSREDVILPDGLLGRIERQTIGMAEHSAQLLAASRSLKRGLLLYGLPGTGKTLTVMYLAGRMPDRSVILLTGRGMGLFDRVANMARQLAPSMVVLEDVDLIAEERGQPFMRSGPLLFELLNEMDGLRDDCDVIFVLTTNRPDILEPALAARPGRVDLAVELPLPDADGRRRLFHLYGRGLETDGFDWSIFVERTDGATPAYIKELLRKAALLAVETGDGARLTNEHVESAMDELAAGGRLAERILGFKPAEEKEARGPQGPMPPGFPSGGWSGLVTRG